MLKPEWTPTRIVQDRARPVIVEPERPTRSRLLTVLRVFIGLWVSLKWAKLRGRADAHVTGTKVKAALERLGGMWIKVGQFVGMRTDLFSPELCEMVGQLQDNAQGFPFHYVRQTIEEDLGRPLEQIFHDFDPMPFSAASVGQLHTARLGKDGTLVAVKVRRPFIEEVFDGDIAIIRLLTSTMHWLGVKPNFRWKAFYGEFRRTLIEELDYRYEVNALRRMRKNFKDHKKIYAPKVYRKVSGRRVMAMEFTHGVLMADVLRLMRTDPEAADRWFATNNVDPHVVAERLYTSQIRQRIIDNLVHGDLHPGNIVLLRDNRICLIDFGSVGSLDNDMHRRFSELQQALTFKDYGRATDLFLLLPADLPHTDIQQVRVELMRAMSAWELCVRTKGLPFSVKSAVSLFSEMSRIVTRYGVPLPWAMLRANRSTVTLDTSIRGLHPQMNFFKVSGRYHRKTQREMRGRQLRTMGKSVDLAEALTAASENLRRTREQGNYRLRWLRRRARLFQAMPTKLAYGLLAVLNLANGLGHAATLYIVGLYSYQHHDGALIPPGLDGFFSGVPMISRPAWFLIGITAALLFGKMTGLRARFGTPDVELPGRRS